MANKRIKDLGTTASTLAADDYVAIDGNANGTRKIVKGDLVNDISTQVAGTYLDEANNLSDVASKDTSKLNLEVPDVGTAPNEVPLNGQLGSLAYQSADSVSVAELQVESTTGTATTQALTVTDGSTTGLVVQEDGKVSVRGKVSLNVDGSASWGSAEDYGKLTWDTGKAIVRGESGKSLSLGSNGTQDHLIVDTSGNVGIGGSPSYDLHVTNTSSSAAIGITGTGGSKDTWTVTSSDSGGKAVLNFRDEDTGVTVLQLHQDNKLVLSSGGAIDFGSGASTTLDDYEEGTFTPTIYYQNSTGLSISYTTQTGYYTKIGNTVTVHAKVVWTVTGTPVNDNIGIQSFPFSFAQTDLYLMCADSAGVSSVAQAGVSAYYAVAMNSSLTSNLADDIGSGSKTMIMSGTYQTTQ